MYYLLINGQRTGPYTAQDVQRMLRQNSIGYETQFWKDGMMGWETVGAQRNLFETSYNAPSQQSPPQYQQQQQYQQPPQQYYQQPLNAYQPQSLMNQPTYYVVSKSRLSYILLGLFLGGFGIHNFYAGYTNKALTQLLLNLFLFWTVVVPIGIGIWVIVEICTVDTDANGVRMN